MKGPVAVGTVQIGSLRKVLSVDIRSRFLAESVFKAACAEDLRCLLIELLGEAITRVAW